MASIDVLTSLTLVNGLREPGNGGAWRIFLDRYQELIGQWCRQMGLNRSDADEVSSAVLGKLVEGIGNFDPARRFRPWLKTVVHNEVRDLQRRRCRRPGDWGSGDSDVQARLENLQAPEESLICQLDAEVQQLREAARKIAAAVQARVLPHTWEAFELTEAEGLAAEEVARRLGMTIAAVYKARHRVLGLLREEGNQQSLTEAGTEERER
jgi:RNA polymerase sigma-70 factor (ECF subfamily)